MAFNLSAEETVDIAKSRLGSIAIPQLRDDAVRRRLSVTSLSGSVALNSSQWRDVGALADIRSFRDADELFRGKVKTRQQQRKNAATNKENRQVVHGCLPLTMSLK